MTRTRAAPVRDEAAQGLKEHGWTDLQPRELFEPGKHILGHLLNQLHAQWSLQPIFLAA